MMSERLYFTDEYVQQLAIEAAVMKKQGHRVDMGHLLAQLPSEQRTALKSALFSLQPSNAGEAGTASVDNPRSMKMS